MSFTNSAFAVAPETVLSYAGQNRGKKLKIRVYNLSSKGSIYVEKVDAAERRLRKQTLLLSKNKTKAVFANDKGTINVIAFLNLKITSANEIAFGVDMDSDTLAPETVAAWLSLSAGKHPDFENIETLDSNAFIPFEKNVGVPDMNLAPFAANLKAIFPEGGWINIRVNKMPDGRFVLGKGLIVHLFSTRPIGIIKKNASAANDINTRSLTEEVQNSSFNLNLDDYSEEVWMYGLASNDDSNFIAGDQKDDASVLITEVDD